MPEISVIVSDLGNVLLPFDYSPMITKFNEIEQGMGDKFALKYKENYHIHRSFEKWEISNGEFLSIMMEWTNHKMTEVDFCRIYSNIFSVNQSVIDLLPRLKKNYKLVLLSNTNEIHKKYGYGHHSFLNVFDKLFLSHEVGAIKPEEKIYRAVEEYTNVPSSQHLFIDDIAEYAEGARKAGWSAIQFKGYENLVDELQKAGIKF